MNPNNNEADRYTKLIQEILVSTDLPKGQSDFELKKLVREVYKRSIVLITKPRTGPQTETVRISKIIEEIIEITKRQFKVRYMDDDYLHNLIKQHMRCHHLDPEVTCTVKQLEDTKEFRGTDDYCFVRSMEKIREILGFRKVEDAMKKFFSVILDTLNDAWKKQNREDRAERYNRRWERVHDADHQNRNVNVVYNVEDSEDDEIQVVKVVPALGNQENPIVLNNMEEPKDDDVEFLEFVAAPAAPEPPKRHASPRPVGSYIQDPVPLKRGRGHRH